MAKAAEGKDLGHTKLLDLLADPGQRLHRRACLQRPAFNTPRQDAANERISTQRRGQHSKRLTRRTGLPWGRDMGDDKVEQRIEVGARPVKLRIRPARASAGIKMRKVELIVIRLKRGKQIEHLVERAVRLGIRLVDLVQDHNRTQPQR